jgi:hypothetical protein
MSDNGSVIPIAHAGGGDELLLALVPVLVFMAVFRLVRGPGQEAVRQPQGKESASR